MWNYDEGIEYFHGTGHSGSITAVRISPDATWMVSVDDEGCVMVWAYPTPEGQHMHVQ